MARAVQAHGRRGGTWTGPFQPLTFLETNLSESKNALMMSLRIIFVSLFAIQFKILNT
jgi:hypothetical protein